MTELQAETTPLANSDNLPVMAKDSYYLSRLKQQLNQIKDKDSDDYTTRLAHYQKQLKHSQAMVQSRIASIPTIHLN